MEPTVTASSVGKFCRQLMRDQTANAATDAQTQPLPLPVAIRRGQDALRCLEQEDTNEGVDFFSFLYGAGALALYLNPFVGIVSAFLSAEGLSYWVMMLLPSKATIVSKAEAARVEQVEHIRSKEAEIRRLDEQRANALQSIRYLRMALHSGRVAGQEAPDRLVGQDAVASCLLTQLLKGVHTHCKKLHELNDEHEESETRLKLIEQGQREIASMNDEDAWIYIAKNAEKVKAEQAKKDSESKSSRGNCCVIL